MTDTLETPLGPVPWVPRNFAKMPRNFASPRRTRADRLRGVTVHYAGSTIGGRYRNAPIEIADEGLVADAIRTTKSRLDSNGDPVSDVGYQILIGRSGIVWEGRGVDWENAANGKLTTAQRAQYPAGVTYSNPYWQSIFLCAGVDGEYASATAEQWESAKKMVAYNFARFNIQNGRVVGHRDVCATACPGNAIYPRLGELVPGFTLPPLPPIPPTGCECAAAIALAKLQWLKVGSGYPGTSQAQQDAVWWLQTGLNQQMPAGVKKLKVDHLFGTVTEKSVIAFQKANRIVVDGEVGPQTWNTLYP